MDPRKPDWTRASPRWHEWAWLIQAILSFFYNTAILALTFPLIMGHLGTFVSVEVGLQATPPANVQGGAVEGAAEGCKACEG